MKKQYNRKKSELYFHIQPENLNCAQAILKGFQKEFNVTENDIEAYRAWGGGRAPEGICGALFSANRLLNQVGKPSITKDFNTKVSEINCSKIKAIHFPCLKCIEIADELLERMK